MKDRFEIKVDVKKGDSPRTSAISALAAAVAKISAHYNVCPLCLTYTLAHATSVAEEDGSVEHLEDDYDKEITLQ